jgi:ubiquinone/menaquinone biosynthesis C-methylase UbiE
MFQKIGTICMNKNPNYDDEYYLHNHQRHLNSFYGFIIELYYRYLAFYIMTKPVKIKKGDKILDIGCGIGILEKQFDKLGYNAIGVDVNRAAIKNSVSPKNCFLVKTTAKLDYPDSYFDLIVSREVLEHISEAEIDDCLKEYNRVGKGKMVHIIAVSERGKSAKNDPTHLNVRSEKWWAEKFFNHGYTVKIKPKKLFFSPFGSSGYFLIEKFKN